MEQSKNLTIKEKRETQAIIENLELGKIIMYVYRGQVLEMDLKDFCMKYEVFRTEDAFNYAIEKMVRDDIIKRESYPNAATVAIVAKTCLNRFMCQLDDSIDYSVEQVKLNSFLTYLILNNIDKPHNCSINTLVDIINSQSTFLHKKYDVENGYNFFKSHFKLNSIATLQFRCAMYRRIKGLKNINNKEYSKKDDLDGYTNSFATFVNKNIYTLYKDDQCTFFILDLSNNLKSDKVGKAIGFIVGTLFEQLEESELPEKLSTVKFEIITREMLRQEKVINSFRTVYNEEHETSTGKVFEIKRYKEHLLDSINKAVKKKADKVEYQDKNKESKGIFEFNNDMYSHLYGLNIIIEVIDAGLNDRLTLHTRTTNVKTARAIRHEKEMEVKLRKKIENDIEEKLRKKYELIYSAREEDIRQQVLREYNLDHPTLEAEMKELAELNELDKSKKEPK